MNTKEAIEFVENTIYLQNKSDNIITYERFDYLARETIELLQCGEKYEQIVRDLDNFFPEEDMKIPEEYLSIKGGVIRYITRIIKQKYFPIDKVIKK